MANYRVVIILLIISQTISCNPSNDNADEDDVFVATNDWQVVKKGQKIPQGLHVRMDLSTGVTEAKLLDENEKTNEQSNSIVHVPQDNDEPIEPKQIPQSQLRDKIANLQDNTLDPDTIKSIKDKFRNYEELKQTLNELNLTPRLDSEIITELLTKHDELSGIDSRKDEILQILDDLDYLTHQYDNAQEFVDRDGFKRLIYKNLNTTNTEIRSATLKLLATITQNNNKPKIKALETGMITLLLRFIDSEQAVGVKLRALTALSCLLRSFPVAQRKFIENGGFTIINNYFVDDSHINNEQIRLQIKIVTMISDLIIEHRYAAGDEKLQPYYYNFDFIRSVLESNWCENLNKLLYRLMIVDNQDYDSIEKCLVAMHSLRQQCGYKFNKKLLASVQLQYTILIDNEENDFLKSLKRLCDEILDSTATIKTEL